MRFLITGATGRVGGSAMRLLLADGHQVDALVRRPDAPLPDGVRPQVADLTDPGSLQGLPEVDGVLLVFPSVHADPWAAEVVAALADRGRQLVYLSAAGAEHADPSGDGIMSSHARLERLIVQSGVRSTFLRASGFAANTLAWAPSIAAGRDVRGPHADAVRSLIHEDDLASVGVLALTEQRLTGPQHLTGPQQLTQREHAAIIGDVIGRRVRYVELTEDEALDELFGELPEDFGRSILRGQGALVANPEPVTGTVAELLGRPARTYAQWVDDHRSAFVTA